MTMLVLHKSGLIAGILFALIPVDHWVASQYQFLAQYRAVEFDEVTETGTISEFEEGASPAVDFLDSLGICIHHGQGVDYRSYIKPLIYLGIKNVRDDLGSDSRKFLELSRATGVKINLIANTKSITDTIDYSRVLAAEGRLLALEGPNEPNNFPITHNGKSGGGVGGAADWTAVAEFQKDLYMAVKGDIILKDTPVFNVSEVGAMHPNLGLQYLTVPNGANVKYPDGTKFADYANVHNYVSSTQNIYVDNQAWNAADPTLNGPWDGLYVEYGKLWSQGYIGYKLGELQALPRVTTETGWDSISNYGGERIQGNILLNTYLAQYKRKWKYTFIYMLRDGEGGDGHQGVYNKDSSRKLAAVYIHNLTSILADSKGDIGKTNLKIRVAGGSDKVHSFLLKKTNGAFFLVIWGERVAGSERISINVLDGPKIRKVYDPTLSESPIQEPCCVDSYSVSISDHPIIIEIQ